MSTPGGPPDPYGYGQGNPSGYGQGNPSGYGQGNPSGYGQGTNRGPYTHAAPDAAPSAPGHYGGGQTYQRPGAYGPAGGYTDGGYGGYPPVAAYQNGAGGWAVGLGIGSLVLCMVPVLSQLIAVAAIITGVIGRKAASDGRANNGGMALAGIIIGSAVLVVSLVLWIGWWGLLGTEMS